MIKINNSKMELLDFTVLKDFFISFPNYEIKGILGTGSFSTVIRVYDKIQHEEIAVKVKSMHI